MRHTTVYDFDVFRFSLRILFGSCLDWHDGRSIGLLQDGTGCHGVAVGGFSVAVRDDDDHVVMRIRLGDGIQAGLDVIILAECFGTFEPFAAGIDDKELALVLIGSQTSVEWLFRQFL